MHHQHDGMREGRGHREGVLGLCSTHLAPTSTLTYAEPSVHRPRRTVAGRRARPLARAKTDGETEMGSLEALPCCAMKASASVRACSRALTPGSWRFASRTSWQARNVRVSILCSRVMKKRFSFWLCLPQNLCMPMAPGGAASPLGRSSCVPLY